MMCVELFAGAGGAALGLEAAGIEHLALVENDVDACRTLRAAGLGPVIEGDVRDLDTIEAAITMTEEQAWNRAGDMLLDDPREGDDWGLAREALATQLLQPQVDLLWSSFPCQAWSSAGKRQGAADERNGWPWTVAAIDRLQPRWFMGENVRGLLSHTGICPRPHPEPDRCPRCYFDATIMGQLEERFAHVGWWLLDAADYGVPQHRRRVILWAGPAPLTPPARTHGPGLFTQPFVSMGEALGLSGQRAIGGGRNPTSDPNDTKGTAYLLRPSPTVTTTEIKGTRASRSSGWTFNGGPDRASDALFMGTGRRRLTVEECATLQSFPSTHPWQGTKTARYRQVGNAVPPPLAQVVAARVIEADASL